MQINQLLYVSQVASHVQHRRRCNHYDKACALIGLGRPSAFSFRSSATGHDDSVPRYSTVGSHHCRRGAELRKRVTACDVLTLAESSRTCRRAMEVVRSLFAVSLMSCHFFRRFASARKPHVTVCNVKALVSCHVSTARIASTCT